MLFFLCVCFSRDSWLDYESLPTQGRLSLPSLGPLGLPPKEDSSHQSAVIKMGWLDKNPPQGYEH